MLGMSQPGEEAQEPPGLGDGKDVVVPWTWGLFIYLFIHLFIYLSPDMFPLGRQKM